MTLFPYFSASGSKTSGDRLTSPLRRCFMRYTKLMLVLLGFAATLCAADPFVGTWKMNVAKTKYKVGTAPKEQTVTISETGSEMSVKVEGTAADGSKILLSYTMP